MHKFWTVVARFFAALIAIAFVVTAALALLLVNVDRRLLDSGTYKRVLAEQQVYARMPRILAEQLVTTMGYNPCAANPLVCEDAPPEFHTCARQALDEERYDILAANLEHPTEADLRLIRPCVDLYGVGQQADVEASGGPPPFMKSFGMAEWETIIAALFPPEELKAMAEETLDQVFAYLDGRQDTASISMVALKNRIAGPAGLEAVLGIIRAQPPCADLQVGQILAGLAGNGGELLGCRPPDEVLTLMSVPIQVSLRLFASQIPDEQVLFTPESGENSASPGPLGNGPVGGIRLARLLMRLSPDLPLLLLLFISLLAVRTAKGWLRWWGIPFFFAGLLSVVVAVTVSAGFEQVWLALLAGRIPPYLSLGLVTLGHDLLRAVFQVFMNGVGFHGVLLSLLGLGMWIGAGRIEPKAEKTLPAS